MDSKDFSQLPQLTALLKDFYNLDTSKMDSWNIMIENDQMEWLGDADDDEELSEDDEDDSDMDTD